MARRSTLLITSVESLPDDGVRITFRDGTVYQVTSNDLPAAVKNKTVQQCEAWVNTYLANQFADRDMYAKVHIITIVPLRLRFRMSSSPIPDYPGPGWER